MIKPTVGISIDVELSGPSLLKHSCLQIGAVVFYMHNQNPNPYIIDEWVVDKREWSLLPQEGKTHDPATMLWMLDQPGLMEYIEDNARDVHQCVGEFCQWYNDLSQRYKIDLIVSSPASVDYAWITNLVSCYRPEWAPRIELPYGCRCLATMLHIAEKYCDIDTRSEQSALRQHPFPANHMALMDAMRQAFVYLKLKMLLRQHKSATTTSRDSQPQSFSLNMQNCIILPPNHNPSHYNDFPLIEEIIE